MRKAVFFSVSLHVGVVAAAMISLPRPEYDMIQPANVIDVEVLTEADLESQEPPEQTAAVTEELPPEPPPEAEPPPPPPPPPEPPPPPPPPEPVVEPEPVPEPEPAPEPEPVVEPEPVPEPEPEPEPEPVVEPEPEPVPEPEPKPEVAKSEPPPPPQPKPKAKPKEEPPKKEPPKDDFASLLKTVQDLSDEKPPPPKQEEKKEEPKTSLADAVKSALNNTQPTPTTASARAESALSLSELDAVRRQIAGCWNVPAGARNAENLIVEVRIEVNPDRTVRDARLVDPSKASDQFWRTAAESALRAVLNPRCSPLKLPPDKYDTWRSIIFTFNPQEMLG
ncbi:MAG: energy transducer TonB [Alphaproteobacteria bacterium]